MLVHQRAVTETVAVAELPACIECTRLKLMSLVRRARHSPDTAIWRSRVAALQSAVDQKLDTRDADVITRRCRDRDVCFARNDRAVCGIGDRDCWRNVVASGCESDPVNRTIASREVVKKTIRRDLQIHRK